MRPLLIFPAMPDKSSIPQIPVVIFNDTRVDRHHGCDLVVRTLEQQLAAIGCHVIASVPAHADWQRNDYYRDRLQQAKLLIVNGEGSIHHSRPEGLYLLNAGEYANQHSIPAVLINCSWESNNDLFLAKLGNFALISARESSSQEQIQRAGIACRLVPDLCILTEYAARHPRQGIGYTDSVLREATYMLEECRQLYRGKCLTIQYSGSGVAGAYNFFRGYAGFRDLLHPHTLLALLKLRYCQFSNQARSVEDMLDVIASLKLLVTGRFHACIFALLTRTPFITIKSNTHKISALIRDAGLAPERYVEGDLSTCLREPVVQEWQDGELLNVERYLNDGRRKIHELFSAIRQLI